MYNFIFKLVIGKLYGDMKVTQDIADVPAKIKHALLARYPRRRYVTGNDGSFGVFLTHIPTMVVDLLVLKVTPVLGPSNDTS